jgi:hypothetical protein
MSTPSLTQLKEAIAIAEQIEKLQAQLASLIGGSVTTVAPVVAAAPAAPAVKARKGGKRFLSPEARERIAAAQRARWSKAKGTTAPAAPAKESEPVVKKGKKRKLTPEGRAKIVAALKARWAKNKAA